MDFKTYIKNLFATLGLKPSGSASDRAIDGVVLKQTPFIPILESGTATIAQPLFEKECYGPYGVICKPSVAWVVLHPGEYSVSGTLDYNIDMCGVCGLISLAIKSRDEAKSTSVASQKVPCYFKKDFNKTISVTQPAILWVWAGNAKVSMVKKYSFTPPVTPPPPTPPTPPKPTKPTKQVMIPDVHITGSTAKVHVLTNGSFNLGMYGSNDGYNYKLLSQKTVIGPCDRYVLFMIPTGYSYLGFAPVRNYEENSKYVCAHTWSFNKMWKEGVK